MTTKVDAIVLGAGNAGQAAAGELRAAGRSVVIAEAAEVGGTCPLRGCVPKKVFVAAAETLDAIARASRHGVEVAAPRLDWPTLVAKKRAIVAGTSASQEDALRARGIELVRGRARFVGMRSVDIGGARYEADVIVVAIGARPRPLEIEGASQMVTSDTLLDLDTLPESIAFVGAGVVSFELAHVFVRAGTKVTMLEIGDRALSTHDPSCVERLVQATRALGVEVLIGARPTHIAAEGAARVVGYEHEGRKGELRAALVANGAGRVPDYEALSLEAAGIALHRGKPRLDAQLRSLENTGVWFAGDARPGPQLSPLATYDGHLVGRAILGRKVRLDHESVPSVVFTIPPLASVGKTEEEAKEAGLAVDVIETDMRDWKSARTYGEDEAYAKVLVDKNTGRIVGAHILRRRAEEAIHAFASAMKHGMTANDLREEVLAFPTVTADAKHLVG